MQELEKKSKIKGGCVGWSYEDWVGPFYPLGSQPKDYLPFYSTVFDVVEIDSTFYSSPNDWLVHRWREVTPDDFQFTVKIPETITHEKRLRAYDVELAAFVSLLQGLQPKLKCLLAQMPPSFNFRDDFDALSEFVRDDKAVRGDLKLAVELRNTSFFRDETFDLFWENEVCFVWSVNQYTRDFPARVTSDFLYVRFIGDRRLTKFDRIQLNRTSILEESWRRISSVLGSVEEAFVFSNNHFAGFAPGTIREFKKIAGI
jgi:uncharacterized protein YecE (DUF72 family)